MKVYDVFYEVKVTRCVRVAAEDRIHAYAIGEAFAKVNTDGYEGITEVSGTKVVVGRQAGVMSSDTLLKLHMSSETLASLYAGAEFL